MPDSFISPKAIGTAKNLLPVPTKGSEMNIRTSSAPHELELGTHARDDEIEDEGVELPEPTPLEYGRENGLMRNHLIEKYAEIEEMKKTVVIDSLDDSHLPHFELGEEFMLEERMPLSKDGATLLASITREDTSQAMEALIAPILESARGVEKMKLDLPLLRSDNATDCKKFARRKGFEIKIGNVKLPLEAVDEENGQGLGWPARFWNVGPKLLEDLKVEKIGISKYTLAYLSNSLKVDWSETGNHSLWNSELKHKRVENTALELVTLPLSPLYSKADPYEPSLSESVFDVPILSDPLSPTKKQLEELEERIFMQDTTISLRHHPIVDAPSSGSSSTSTGDEVIRLGDAYNSRALLDSSGVLHKQEGERLRRHDLQVEEPLTPEGPLISPLKPVRFSEVGEEMLMDSPQSRLNSPAFVSNFFEDAFVSGAAIANQKLEQEELVEADATARVDIPVMDFSKMNPPWAKFETQRDPGNLLLIQNSFIRDVVGPTKIWPGRRKSDHKLRWIPWEKNDANGFINEQIQVDKDILETFVGAKSLQGVINSSSLAWKPLGLMILRDGDDDDEIELGSFLQQTPLDLTSLLKKKKLELQERAATENKSRVSMQPLTCAKGSPAEEGCSLEPTATNANAVLESSQKLSATGDDLISSVRKTKLDLNAEEIGTLLGGPFSTANSLNNFLEVRGNKRVKLTESSYFRGSISKSLNKVIQVPENHPPPKPKSPVEEVNLPVPPVMDQIPPAKAVVASTFLKQRLLINHINKILPHLELIERDFSAHNTTAWMLGSVTRSPVVSPLAAEADLIVSTSMGIIVTTLQKIKQKLLPGQKGKTAIRNRVEQVSLRYETLVVFVSEGRQDESTYGLDESDCLSFSDFIGFTVGLGTSVSVQFVAGGEETMAKWIAHTIVQYLGTELWDLLIDETLWELFLRRAGMNAFAAQAIIELLKAPEGVDHSSPSKAGQFGLTAFVEMGQAERIAKFGRFCGRKLLERVSAVIDGKWEI